MNTKVVIHHTVTGKPDGRRVKIITLVTPDWRKLAPVIASLKFSNCDLKMSAHYHNNYYCYQKILLRVTGYKVYKENTQPSVIWATFIIM